MSSRNGRYVAALGGLIASFLCCALPALAQGDSHQQGQSSEGSQPAVHSPAASSAPTPLAPLRPAANKGKAKVAAPQQPAEPIWIWLPGFFDRHNGSFSALAAIAVAGFTFWLIRVGSRQHKAAMGALELANKEFNAAHRPKLIIRDVDCALVGGRRVIRWSVVNVGDADGTIVEEAIGVKIVGDGKFAKTERSKRVSDQVARTIEAGRQEDCTIDVSIQERMMMGDHTVSIVGSVHLLGNIVYEDKMGRRRRTIFQRKHVRDEDIFVELGNPNYEYAD